MFCCVNTSVDSSFYALQLFHLEGKFETIVTSKYKANYCYNYFICKTTLLVKINYLIFCRNFISNTHLS